MTVKKTVAKTTPAPKKECWIVIDGYSEVFCVVNDEEEAKEIARDWIINDGADPEAVYVYQASRKLAVEAGDVVFKDA